MAKPTRPEPTVTGSDGEERIYMRSPQGGGELTITAVPYAGEHFLTFDAESGDKRVRIVVDQPGTRVLASWLVGVLAAKTKRHPAEDP